MILAKLIAWTLAAPLILIGLCVLLFKLAAWLSVFSFWLCFGDAIRWLKHRAARHRQ